MTQDLKPCVQCGEPCGIWGIQLGDIFTLRNLRICGADCLFMQCYDFIYENHLKYEFRNYIDKLESKEDGLARQKLMDDHMELALNQLKKSKFDSELLKKPMSPVLQELFGLGVTLASTDLPLARFTRITLEERIKHAKDYLERQRELLLKAEQDLIKLESEES